MRPMQTTAPYTTEPSSIVYASPDQRKKLTYLAISVAVRYADFTDFSLIVGRITLSGPELAQWAATEHGAGRRLPSGLLADLYKTYINPKLNALLDDKYPNPMRPRSRSAYFLRWTELQAHECQYLIQVLQQICENSTTLYGE